MGHINIRLTVVDLKSWEEMASFFYAQVAAVFALHYAINVQMIGDNCSFVAVIAFIARHRKRNCVMCLFVSFKSFKSSSKITFTITVCLNEITQRITKIENGILFTVKCA